MDSAADRVNATGRDGSAVEIGPLRYGEVGELAGAFADVVARGDGYPQLPPLTRSTFDDVWVHPVTAVVAATVGGTFAGAYYLKPNGMGLAAHIANAGYVVARAERGRGIGRLLVADSIERARLLGFDAVQFNFVFDSNPARPLYEELGWREVGRIPGAVRRPGRDPEDALIYWRAV